MPTLRKETSEYLKNLKKVMLIQKMYLEVEKYRGASSEDIFDLVQVIRSTRLEYDTLIKELFYE